MNNIKFNSELPENVCISVYDMEEFPIYLNKLNNLWSGIIMPEQPEQEVLKWTFGYLEYKKKRQKCYVIWFFNNTISEEQIILEVKDFLLHDK